jgi:uncharacterized protein involved in exopolysaccharide biosynthesis
MTPAQQLPTLTAYASRVRRDGALILAMMLVGLLVGAGVVFNSPRVFTATATVLLQPVPTAVPLSGSESDPSSITIDTQAQLVTSDRVVDQVVSATELNVDEARAALRVTAFPLSEVLRISATTSDPVESREAAQVAAEAVLDLRERLSLEARAPVGDLRARLGEIRLQIKNRNAPSAYALRTRLYRQASFLREEDQSDIDAGRIISPAVTPTQPAGSSPEVHVAGFAMGGLLLGVVIGELRGRRGRLG